MVPLSPSDHRSLKNLKSSSRRQGVEVQWQARTILPRILGSPNGEDEPGRLARVGVVGLFVVIILIVLSILFR